MRVNSAQRLVAVATVTAIVLGFLVAPRVHVVQGTIVRHIPTSQLAPVIDLRFLFSWMAVVLLVGVALWFAAAGLDEGRVRTAALTILFGSVRDDGRRRGGLVSMRIAGAAAFIGYFLGAVSIVDSHATARLLALAGLGVVGVWALTVAALGALRRRFVEHDADALATIFDSTAPLSWHAKHQYESVIRGFAHPDHLDRYLTFLQSPHGASQFRARLANGVAFNRRFVRPLGQSEQNRDSIARLLRLQGAPSRCYCFSEDVDLDAHELDLDEALRRVVGRRTASLLLCVPGRLAYYQGGNPVERYILEREE